MESLLRQQLPSGKFINVCKVRSRTMSAIKGKNNKSTEIKFRLALIRNGIKGWRRHRKEIFGSPDFYFRKERVAVFIDGCFWHGCSKCGHIPKTRTEFWQLKIKRNKLRRRKVKFTLRKNSIRVLRIWEHSLKNYQLIQKVLQRLSEKLGTSCKRVQPKEKYA